MSYLHPDGSPDTLDDVLESCRCFVGVLSKLLKPNEGMIVELKFQPKHPLDRHGKYLVWRDTVDAMIKVERVGTDHPMYTAEGGQMVWVHNEMIH